MLGTMDNLKKLMEINLTITQSDLRYFQIIRNIFKRKRELLITDSMFAQKIGEIGRASCRERVSSSKCISRWSPDH